MGDEIIANTKDKAEALPTVLKEAIKQVAYNVKAVGGDLKFSAKTNNVSDPKSNIFSPQKFMDFLYGKSDMRNAITKDYLYPDMFSDEKSVMALVIHFFTQAQTDKLAPPASANRTTISDQLNWSAAAGSRIEQARSQRYWVLNKKDAEFLRFIKVAQAGEDTMGSLVVYVKNSVIGEVYSTVGPMSSINVKELVSLLSSVVIKKGISLFDKLEKEYIEYIQHMYDHRTKFDGCVFGAMTVTMSREGEEWDEYCAYTFPDYLTAIVKQQKLSDMVLRLDAEPVGISAKLEIPTFYYFDRDKVKIANGGTPHWDNWMQVIPELYHPVFMAWIYSVFVPQNRGRQALWLHSGGYDGKSQMALALTRYMNGHGVGSINSNVAKSQFGYAAAYGKRLLIFGDCQNDKFLKTNLAHSVLGGDPAAIEYKGRSVFTARVFCKLLICSNKRPVMNVNASHETTRLIYIPLQTPTKEVQAKFLKTDDDGNILYDSKRNPFQIGYNSGIKNEKGKELSDYLYQEMDTFLNKCRLEYLELCPHHKEIITSGQVRETLYTICASEPSEIYEDYINEYFEFTTDKEVYELSSDMKMSIRDHFTTKRMEKVIGVFRIEDFIAAFEKIATIKLRDMNVDIRQYNVVQRSITVDGKTTRKRVYNYVKFSGEPSEEFSLTGGGE